MVGATHGTPEGFRADQASGSQQPPPPPPNLAEVMARQIELLNLLVQAQQNQHRQQSRAGRDDPHPQVANYQDFLSTQPPLFHKADEPLDADAWLRTIESKFALLPAPCSDEKKELFAAQQLRSTARIWWDHYDAMQPAGHVITWDEFRTAFRAHHIPKGLLSKSSMNFWIWLKAPAPFCNMHKFLATCASTRGTMRTMMPTNEIVFAEAWTPNLKNDWIW
jgi:hypothetical protein